MKREWKTTFWDHAYYGDIPVPPVSPDDREGWRLVAAVVLEYAGHNCPTFYWERDCEPARSLPPPVCTGSGHAPLASALTGTGTGCCAICRRVVEVGALGLCGTHPWEDPEVETSSDRSE